MAESDDPEAILNKLITFGALRERNGGLSESELYRETYEDALDASNDSRDAYAEIAERYVPDGEMSVPRDLFPSVEILASINSIERLAPEFPTHLLLPAAISMKRVESLPSDVEVPDGFVPLFGWEVEYFIEQHTAAILYFWSDDCPPCDRLREDFSELVSEGAIQDDVGLAAIYCSRDTKIDDKFDITITPTTLFSVRGNVYSRLIGDHPKNTVLAEINKMYAKAQSDPG